MRQPRATSIILRLCPLQDNPPLCPQTGTPLPFTVPGRSPKGSHNVSPNPNTLSSFPRNSVSMTTFPEFEWDQNYWTSSASIPAWSRHQTRRDNYGGLSSDAPSDDIIRIVFAPKGRNNSPLLPQELELVQWAISNAPSIQDAAIKALYTYYQDLYPSWRSDLDSIFGEEDADEMMPEITSPNELKRLIRVSFMFVHQIATDGVPYVGFEFDCTWDEEHGAGVLLHGTRVIETGGADVSFQLSIAKKDAESKQ